MRDPDTITRLHMSKVLWIGNHYSFEAAVRPYQRDFLLCSIDSFNRSDESVLFCRESAELARDHPLFHRERRRRFSLLIFTDLPAFKVPNQYTIADLKRFQVLFVPRFQI